MRGGRFRVQGFSVYFRLSFFCWGQGMLGGEGMVRFCPYTLKNRILTLNFLQFQGERERARARAKERQRERGREEGKQRFRKVGGSGAWFGGHFPLRHNNS